MVKIINSSNETLAILQNVVSPLVSEEINREFTFSFSTVIDNSKSDYVNYQNKVEAEENYFNIVYTEEERTKDGLFINAQCEHVSYGLISASLTAGFTATGPFSAVATTLLSGTGFTLGTVQITASQTISVNESTNKRQVLMQLASLYGGELGFSKYVISLYTQRGANQGVQFRYRKNLVGVKRIIDNRKKVGGLPTTSYQVSAAELEFEQGFIAGGVSALEHYELGDTVQTIDDDLSLDASLRIVKESHDPEQRMQGTVEISNFIEDLSDTLTTIQTTSVSKDNVYNGCSIGPENGFVAERSDGIAKTEMNATEGITINLRDTTTAAYTAIFYVQIDTATGTAKLYLVGNAEFTGIVRSSEIIGGSILIGGTAIATAPFSVTSSGAATADNLLLTGGVIQVGTTNNTFRFNETDGLWIGNTLFASASFKVSMSGSATASNLNLTGGLINIGTGTNTMQFNITDGLFLGATSVVTAPFSVSMTGAVTASNLNMSGGSITGGDINVSSDLTVGNAIYLGDNLNVNKLLRLRTDNSADITIQGYTSIGPGLAIGYLSSSASATATLGQLSEIFLNATTIYAEGDVSGLVVSSVLDHNHGIPNGTVLQTVTGTITWAESGGHGHSCI